MRRQLRIAKRALTASKEREDQLRETLNMVKKFRRAAAKRVIKTLPVIRPAGAAGLDMSVDDRTNFLRVFKEITADVLSDIDRYDLPASAAPDQRPLQPGPRPPFQIVLWQYLGP